MNKDELEETVRFAQHANALLNMQLLKLQESLPKNVKPKMTLKNNSRQKSKSSSWQLKESG